MKALSIRQPYAWLIIYGGKNIENRKWRTKYRGRFLVHASAREDKEAMQWFRKEHPEVKLDYGSVIGSVDLVDCVDNSHNPWFTGPQGFVLKDPKPEPVVKFRGKLNFFEIPDGL